jgi:hypothetical protein
MRFRGTTSYAEAMVEATGKNGDGECTLKSGLYQAGQAALYGSSAGGSCRDFLKKVLVQVSLLAGMDIDEFLDWVGEDAAGGL